VQTQWTGANSSTIFTARCYVLCRLC